jgi:peptide/nickel transport system permease protein
MSAISDTALQAAPASKARGYWATVGRRIVRDKVSMACALILAAIFLSALLAPWLGLADPYQGSISARRAIRSAPTNSAATCWRA